MALLLTWLVLVTSSGSGAPPAQDVAAPQAAQLLIDFVAVDRQGVPVVDLTPDELEVWIGHFRVPIAAFSVVTPASGERSERTIVLLVDDVTLPPASVPRAREAARRFVDRMMPGDRITMVMLSGTSIESTDDRGRLLRAIDTFTTRATGLMRIEDLSEQVLQTVASVSRQLAEAPGRRRTIVGIGSGWVFDRPLPPPTITVRDLDRQWIDAMRAMAFSHVSLYVLDPIGVGATPADSGRSGFARESGGRAFLSTNDVKAAVDQILRDASSYYLIRVSDPPVGRKSELRELELRVLRRGVTVLARRSIPGSM